MPKVTHTASHRQETSPDSGFLAPRVDSGDPGWGQGSRGQGDWGAGGKLLPKPVGASVGAFTTSWPLPVG